MASSSVSQESLEMDFEQASRRSRVRSQRARTTPTHTARPSSTAAAETTSSSNQHTSLTVSGGGTEASSEQHHHHDSPSPNRPPSSSRMIRDKRTRPNHLHKGKTAKDKRKLREKRRSTGVVHLPSTESTGDSLDDEEDTHTTDPATRRNTSYNEVIDADNPQTPEESRSSKAYSRINRCKSPSDLEADLEDNQDYDSTISQSETNLASLGNSSHPATPSSSSSSSFTKTQGHVRVDGSPQPSTSSHNSTDLTAALPRNNDLDNDSSQGQKAHQNGVGGSEKGLGNKMNGHQRTSSPSATTRLQDLKQAAYDRTDSRLQNRVKELEWMLEECHIEVKKLKVEKTELETENSWLQQTLTDRDHKVAQLEKEVHLMHQDLVWLDTDNDKLHRENQALIGAMKSLTS